MLTEGTGYFDPTTFEYGGVDLWLFASGINGPSPILILQKLLDLGCKTSGVDPRGRNCLFRTILASRTPSGSRDFERLHFLLSVFGDIYAQDAKSRTIFDLVDGEDHDTFGSYRRDLWYCALERAAMDVSHHLSRHPRKSAYRSDGLSSYTPEHHHALKHLQSWNESNFRSQMDCLLRDIPLEEGDAEKMERIRDWEREWMDDLFEPGIRV